LRSIVISVVVFACMLLEARRAGRNEREQRARGGIEPAGDVYALMQVAYPGAFLAMLVEGTLRGPADPRLVAAGALLFAAAKALKYWTIAALGRCWTFRVLVVPGMRLVTGGPYRWLRHPNYVAVAGELAGVALMTGAAIAGPLGTAGFLLLIARRVRVEDDAILTRG
jgi:methyltransferase